MAYVTYTTATPVALVSLPLIRPCVLVSPLAIVGAKGSPSVAHPAPSSATAANCHSEPDRGGGLLTPVVNVHAIPTAYIAPRVYCVCVSPYQQPCVWGSSVPAGSATCKLPQLRELKREGKKSCKSAQSCNALDRVHVATGTEPLHNIKPFAAKRGHLQAQITKSERYPHEDAEDRGNDTSGDIQEPAVQRKTPGARGRSGHGLPRELGSAARKQTAHVHVKNAERAQDVSTDYSSKGPQNPMRRLKHEGFQRKLTRNSVPQKREWTLEGQLDVEGTVEFA